MGRLAEPGAAAKPAPADGRCRVLAACPAAAWCCWLQSGHTTAFRETCMHACNSEHTKEVREQECCMRVRRWREAFVVQKNYLCAEPEPFRLPGVYDGQAKWERTCMQPSAIKRTSVHACSQGALSGSQNARCMNANVGCSEDRAGGGLIVREQHACMHSQGLCMQRATHGAAPSVAAARHASGALHPKHRAL